MIALEVFVQSKLATFRIHARLHLRCFLFFCLFSIAALPHFARANYKRLFKFVARQVVASVEIRAAKLQFITESRARVYFAKHCVSA